MIAILLALLAVVNTPNSSVSYACDGATAVYTVSYPYLAYTDLVTTTTTAGGVVTTLAYTTDYSVNLSSTSSTATLTLTNPAVKCPAGNTLKITRRLEYTQPNSFKAQTTYNQTLHEQSYDRLAMQIQQLAIVQPSGVALGLQNEGSSLGNVSTLNCVGPGTTCTAVAGAGALTVTTAAPTTIPNAGNTNSAGTADTLALSDHVHALAVGPMLYATTASGQSIPNAAATIIVFGTAVRDTDSVYNSGTGRYTIATGKGGDYLVTSTVTWNAAPGSGTFITLYKNAAELLRAFQGAQTPGGGSLLLNGIVNLAAGDVVDVRVTQSSGAPVALHALAADNFFALKRIQ